MESINDIKNYQFKELYIENLNFLFSKNINLTYRFGLFHKYYSKNI